MARTPTKTYDNLGLLSGDMPALLPTTMVPIQLNHPADIRLARRAAQSGELIGLTPDQRWATPTASREDDGLAMLAQIADFTELHDGRVLLLLRGIERIRILDDLVSDESGPTRTVRAERYVGLHMDEHGEHELRRAILGTLLALASLGIEGADIIHRQVTTIRDPGAVADFVGARIMLHPADRFGLFRETNNLARLQRVEDRLTDLLLQHSLATDSIATNN